MSGFTALAVKPAALASGLGTTLLPSIGRGAVQGFAVGTMLSAVCFLAVMTPRRHSRRHVGRHAAPPPGSGTRLVGRRAFR
jgi:hypothetical protein